MMNEPMYNLAVPRSHAMYVLSLLENTHTKLRESGPVHANLHEEVARNEMAIREREAAEHRKRFTEELAERQRAAAAQAAKPAAEPETPEHGADSQPAE